MANLAFVQGHLDHVSTDQSQLGFCAMATSSEKAEKLFKAAMSFMLSGGTPEDDNAVIEMSLKLATIYAEQNKTELAEHGFRFCLESLQEKLQREEKVEPTGEEAEPTGEEAEPTGEEAEPTEQRKDSRLLLGLCFDSRARYHQEAVHAIQEGLKEVKKRREEVKKKEEEEED
ncbi:hypothetical protein F7725_010775 [Dissostichus mawsoni]|uniref:Uncharacterized protein n=1 Tax=Dissostichus mawsoni TaxID=36200 RepID=A0A7J5Z704_DISMA|nr:hypothetical protein F7725_010775 [Dissostichus mawsoni]